MTKPVDWDALRRLFEPQPAPAPVDARQAREDEPVIYNGEPVPRWLARDLARERAAIMEYEGGLGRAEAEAKARALVRSGRA